MTHEVTREQARSPRRTVLKRTPSGEERARRAGSSLRELLRSRRGPSASGCSICSIVPSWRASTRTSSARSREHRPGERHSAELEQPLVRFDRWGFPGKREPGLRRGELAGSRLDPASRPGQARVGGRHELAMLQNTTASPGRLFLPQVPESPGGVREEPDAPGGVEVALRRVLIARFEGRRSEHVPPPRQVLGAPQVVLADAVGDSAARRGVELGEAVRRRPAAAAVASPASRYRARRR